MDAISPKMHLRESSGKTSPRGRSEASESEKMNITESVTLSDRAKSTKAKKAGKHKTSPSKGSSHARTHKTASATGSVALFLNEENSKMPDHRPGNGCGPDDVYDDGACPGGGRTDNMDNPDSVYDHGGCGSSSGNGYNYSGPDGSFNYDEYH